SATVILIALVPTRNRRPAAVSVAASEAVTVTVSVFAVLATLTGTLSATIRSGRLRRRTFCVPGPVRPPLSFAPGRTDLVPAGSTAVSFAPLPRRLEPANHVSDLPVIGRPASSVALPARPTLSPVWTTALGAGAVIWTAGGAPSAAIAPDVAAAWLKP